jgi:hypothetical protein
MGPVLGCAVSAQPVTGWIDFKRLSSGVNIARRLWDQREYLCHTFEAVHGADPTSWPFQHPGVVLDAVPYYAHAGMSSPPLV